MIFDLFLARGELSVGWSHEPAKETSGEDGCNRAARAAFLGMSGRWELWRPFLDLGGVCE